MQIYMMLIFALWKVVISTHKMHFDVVNTSSHHEFLRNKFMKLRSQHRKVLLVQCLLSPLLMGLNSTP